MTQEEMDKMTVADWEKLFESNAIQPGTVDLNEDISDHEDDETEKGAVNLFED